MPKIIKKLSEAEIRSAQPKKTPYKICDEGGLRLLVRPSGAKVWQYPYTFQGKSNTYTIGPYCPKGRPSYVGTAQARKIRDEIKDLLQQGIDPNKHKQTQRFNSSEKAKTTFEAIAREWHAKGVWVPKHAKNILRSLEDDVFPLIGYKQLDQITAAEIITVISLVEKRGAPDVAKRICQRCEAIFDYGLLKGVCFNNPAAGRSKFIKPPKRKHRPHLKESELPEFLKKLEAYHGHDYIRLGMKLLVMTFVRPGELRNAVWSEIDWSQKLWRIPAERMKMDRDHVVPLAQQTMAILEELKDLTGHSDYIFPSLWTPQKPITDVTLLKVLKILGYDGDKKITPHGFRHTASTILNERRFNRDVIERQLAHADQDKIRSTYNHAEYLPERREMMQWWADYLDNIVQNGTLIVGRFASGMG